MLDLFVKILSWVNPANYIKNYLHSIIDERIKLIISDEKIDNIVRQLTEDDIEYIKHLSEHTNKVVKTNFTGESFNKLKRLGSLTRLWIINVAMIFWKNRCMFVPLNQQSH
jgi:hypothetical protein